MALSTESRLIAGVVLLTVVTIEVGGWFMTRIARGQVPMTDFQKSFARAGHGHAGVLVILSLLGLLYVDATGLTGPLVWIARLGVPIAAILMSAGFFASSARRGATEPNSSIWVVWIGAFSLAAGVISLGIGLLTA
jgi:general stress protein CsbA